MTAVRSTVADPKTSGPRHPGRMARSRGLPALVGAGAAAVLALALGAPIPAFAGPGGIEGSWSGGGTVSFASGNSERARCRVRYSRRSATSYSLSATCATPSGRAVQTATLRKVGGNTYAGTFHNAEYNVSGVIRVTVSGNSQTVSLSGDGGARASLRLTR